MALKGSVSKEISEAISTFLGANAVVTLKIYVKVETNKPDKQEQKVLVLTDHRIHIFSAKANSKVSEDCNVHFLQLQGIESKDIKLIFKYDGGKKIVLFATGNPEEIDNVVFQMSDSLIQIFPHMSLENLIGPLDISPPERMKKINDKLKNKTLHRDITPCGNFSVQYQCMCNFHCLPYLDEVSWDIDTIYMSQNCKTLTLREFDHLDNRYLVSVIATLRYNNWFTSICTSHVKMKLEALNEVANVLKTNTSLERICLENTGIKSEDVQRIATAIMSNIKNTAINWIDFKNNAIGDKGLFYLCPVITKLPRGLDHLNLSKCSISTSGVNKLSEALCSNSLILTTLNTLKLSGNNFREDITNLHNFLAQPNAMTELDLSGTECALDNIFGAIMRACSNLTHLDLSGNVFSTYEKNKRGPVMVPVSWKQYFSATVALQHVNISYNRLPLDAVKNLLLGINSNENLKSVSVNLSGLNLGNEGVQRGEGATMLETCFSGNNNITTLDISDNDFNADLERIIKGLCKSNILKTLKIGKNFQKAKNVPVILDAVVELVNAEDSVLESLSLADSKLKHDTVIVINALAGNTTLVELDITGNGMLDYGGRMLSKALSINTRLQVVHWDRNNITQQGYEDISWALRRNFTLKKMPTPVNDVMIALRMNTERTQRALHKIEHFLQRNNSPRKFGSEQAYRLQQAFLLSTTQQAIDKYLVQLLDTITDLEQLETTDDLMDSHIEKARNLMKDAENCRELLAQLQKIGQKSETGNEVEVKLNYVSDDLQLQLTKQIKNTVSQMVRCAQAKCGSILEDEGMQMKLEKGCSDKSELPKDFSKTLITEQVTTEVYNKISEVNVSVASYISEELLDLLLETLKTCHSELIKHKTGESELDARARVSILRNKDETKSEVQIQSRKSCIKSRPISVAPSEHSTTESQGTPENDLDDFVFVASDTDLGQDTGNKKEQKGEAQETSSPQPSPRNLSHISSDGSVSKRATQPKPPLPSFKKPNFNSTPNSKYKHNSQTSFQKFKPSPEVTLTSTDSVESASNKPKPVPRKKHVKDDDLGSRDSLNRMSDMSSIFSESSPDSGISTSDKKSIDSLDEIISEKIGNKVGDTVTVPIKKPLPPLPTIDSTNSKNSKLTSIPPPKKQAPKIPDESTELEVSSEDEEDEKESKSTGGSLTDTTDTGSVDSLLEDSKPKSKSSDKEKKKHTVSEFDLIAPTTSQKLEHLTKNRPKHTRIRPRVKPRPTNESNIIEEEDEANDISAFFETSTVTKEHKVPVEPPIPSNNDKKVNTKPANSSDDDKNKSSKFKVKEISSSISDFFKKKKGPKEVKSPVEEPTKHKASIIKTKENSSPTNKPEIIENKQENTGSLEKENGKKNTEKEVVSHTPPERPPSHTPPERPTGPRIFPGAQPMMGPSSDMLAQMKLKQRTVEPPVKIDPERNSSSVKAVAGTEQVPPRRPPSLYPKLSSDGSIKPPDNRPIVPKRPKKSPQPPSESNVPPPRPAVAPSKASSLRSPKAPVDDFKTGLEMRPKSDELDNRTQKTMSMFGGSNNAAFNAELLSHTRRVAPPRPQSNLSENGKNRNSSEDDKDTSEKNTAKDEESKEDEVMV